MEGTAESIRFGDVEIDVPALTVRVDGEAVHIEPQVFDVLVYLVRHRDRVVSKNELLDNVWGDRFVSESALTTRIKTARRLIGDDGRTQRMIRTVHGRGYQFVADVVTSTGNRSTPRPPARTTDELVGRDAELTALLDALDHHRLVTVVGPGGVGKTRLVTEAARVWEAEDRPVHVVELDAIASDAQVASLICDVLGVRSQGDVDLIALAAQELRGASPLLVLDNFEHVGGAAVEVARLLESAPDLRVCVSSRERLHLSEEQIITLEPLDTSLELGRDAPAVVLFEARARRLNRAFTVDDSNVGLVSEICRLVDGLPLGLDLAAAQLRHMPLEYLRTHLEQGLAEIALDLHDRPQRQQSVNDLIGWSYEQLAPSSQALLARLSVFRGGIPLSGVRAVGELETDFVALRSMAELVDKSLVVVEPSDAEPRYALLNLIRSYAASRLTAPELEAARAAHASWVADVVAAIEADRWDRDVTGWFGRLSRKYPNIVAALEHLAEAGDLVTLCRIMADTNNWWYNVGRHDEARRWIRLAIEAEADVDPRTCGRVHLLAGLLAFAEQDLGTATDHYRSAFEHSTAAGDWRYAQFARTNLSIRALADPGAADEVTGELQSVVAEATGRGEHAVLAYALNYLGVMLHRTGRGDEALAHHQRAIVVNRRIGDRFGEALNHANIGHIEVEAGRPETALVSSKAALRLAVRVGSSVLAAWMLSEIASAERMLGNAAEGAILLGASDAYVDAIGAHRGPAAHQAWHEVTLAALRTDLGDAEFERLHATGSTLPLKTAIERALQP